MFERKVRPGVKGRDLPRVLLLCHPETPNILEVVDELLKIENICVIYNTDISLLNDVSLVLDSAQMVLVFADEVFVDKKDETLLKNIELLRKQKLPLIPLVANKDYIDEFTNIFGEIQYISFGDKDKFTRKIKGAFDIYLFKEDIAIKIKENFSSFVFVSYRHKDLRDAQRVINAIHSDERNYNVGVWYDDFLTSGEKFNTEIEDEIKNADGFILITTPNLVNEDNYVRKVEYKLAREQNKKIVPIETLDTDKDLLKEQYLDIPDSLRIENQKEIDEEIFSLFAKEEIKEAGQKYYLGVAYLKGIFVENNFDRAIKLLEESSDMGYFPSTVQLEMIYNYGINTDINYEKAVFYQRRIVDYLYSHKEEPSICIKAKISLATLILNSFANSDEIETLLLEAINELLELEVVEHDQVADCYHALLTYYTSRYTNKDLEKVNKLLDSMLNFVEELAKANIPDLYDEITDLYKDIATHYYQINELDLTVKYAKLSFEYNQKALQEDFQGYINRYLISVINISHILSGFAVNIYRPYAEQALKEYEKYQQFNKETKLNKIQYIHLLSLVAFAKSTMHEDPLELIQQADELLLEVDVSNSLNLRTKKHTILLKLADSYQKFSEDYQMIANRYQELALDLANYNQKLESSGKIVPASYYNYYHCLMMLCNYLTAYKPDDEENSRIVLQYLDEITRVNNKKINIDSYKMDNTFGLFHYYGIYLYHYTNIKDKEKANYYFDLLVNTKMTDYKSPTLYPRMEIPITGLAFSAYLLDRQRDLEEYIIKIINGPFKGDKAFEYTFFYYLTKPYLKGICDNWIANRIVQFCTLTCELADEQNEKMEIIRLLIPIKDLVNEARDLGQMLFIELLRRTSHYLALAVKDDKVLPVSKIALDYVKQMSFALYVLFDKEEEKDTFINLAIDLFFILQEAFKTSDHDRIPPLYCGALLYLGELCTFEEKINQLSASCFDFLTRLLDEYQGFYDSIPVLLDSMADHDYDSLGVMMRASINGFKKAIKEHELIPAHIAYLCLSLGDYLLDNGEEVQAMNAYMDCVDEVNEVEEFYSEKTAYTYYAKAFKEIANILHDLGKEEESKQYYEAYLKAQKICDEE